MRGPWGELRHLIKSRATLLTVMGATTILRRRQGNHTKDKGKNMYHDAQTLDTIANAVQFLLMFGLGVPLAACILTGAALFIADLLRG